MRLSGIALHCANCGQVFNTAVMHSYRHRGTGTVLCTKECHGEMEYRYASHILGHATDRATAQEHIRCQLENRV